MRDLQALGPAGGVVLDAVADEDEQGGDEPVREGARSACSRAKARTERRASGDAPVEEEERSASKSSGRGSERRDAHGESGDEAERGHRAEVADVGAEPHDEREACGGKRGGRRKVSLARFAKVEEQHAPTAQTSVTSLPSRIV